MDKRPTVSVLMTAYNREKYVGDAIASVLASSFQDFELIIVDDGSKDRTVGIARDFEKADSRVKVYVNALNLGDYPNRNHAASYASGKYIKYLDSDDLIYDHGLGVMVRSMEKFPEAGMGILSRADYESPYPKLLSPKEIYLEHFDGYGHMHRAPGSVIINREVFNRVGGFSGENLIGDSELWFRIARTYPVVKINEDLYWPRSHSGQVQNAVSSKEYDRLRNDVIDRALSHPECPLNGEELQKVRTLRRRNERRNRILAIIYKLNRLLG